MFIIKKILGYKDRQNEKTMKKVAFFSTISAAIGAFTALLFAPKPGSELRKDIAKKSQEAGTMIAEKAKQATENVNNFTQEVANKGKDMVDKTHDNINDKIHENNNGIQIKR